MLEVSTTSFHTTRSLFRMLNMAVFNRTPIYIWILSSSSSSSWLFLFRLHTRQCLLKTELLPTAVNSLLKKNGFRTRLTSALWTTMSGDYAWTLQVITTQAGEHRCSWYMPAATGLDQQSHIELSERA